jgi:hypothetical protein
VQTSAATTATATAAFAAAFTTWIAAGSDAATAVSLVVATELV